jgi:hypothetical protein
MLKLNSDSNSFSKRRKPKHGHHAGAKALDHHVGVPGERHDDLLGLRRPEVEPE